MAIEDVDVRDGRRRDVLHVAEWAEVGGFRLASGAEILELTERVAVEHPWIPGERRPRLVLLPKVEAATPG